DHLDRVPDHGRQVDALQLESKLSREHAADVEQVRHELGLESRIPPKDIHRAPASLHVRGLAAEQLGPAHYGIEGRPELVGDHGHDLVLDPVRAFRLGARGPLAVEKALPLGVRGAAVGFGPATLRYVAEDEDDPGDTAVRVAD